MPSQDSIIARTGARFGAVIAMALMATIAAANADAAREQPSANAHEHAAHSHAAAPASTSEPIAAGGSATRGDVVIEGAWTRQPPPGAKVGGGYMTITNNGTTAEKLVGGSVPFADVFEVHEMSVVDGVMRMRALGGGLTIAPGETVTLQPGGYHVMFIELTDIPAKGDTVEATLHFENAGEITVEMPVAGMGASSLNAGDAAHGGHGAHGDGGMHKGAAPK